MTQYNRQDQRSVAVIIDGINTGVWSSKDGGDGDSEGTSIHPGGGVSQVPIGGRQTRDNITAAKYFDLDVDLPRIKGWDARRGKAPVTVIEVFLDDDDHVYGQGASWNGRLKRVAWPPYDSESSEGSKVEVEIEPFGDIA